MNIVLTRHHTHYGATDGVLMIDGQKVCDTSENATSALAPGLYNVKIHRCKQYRRKMPCILIEQEGHVNLDCDTCPKLDCVTNNSTLPRLCPQIKIGNGVHKREDGSIIIGERITWGAIAHPVEHFNRLIDRLDKAQNRGEPITLTIK